jgi:transposase
VGVNKLEDMITLDVMNTCPHCQRSDNQVRAGLTRAGSQRYLCKLCQRKYTPEPKPMGHADATRRQAIKLYLDGMNQRRIARQLGISQGSVSNWARAFADLLPDDVPKPEEAVEVAEIDELFTFIERKKTVPSS